MDRFEPQSKRTIPEGVVVIIVLLEPASAPGDLVSFRAQAGRGLGCWRGSGAQAGGVEVDVEIDASGGIDWNLIEEVANPLPTMLVRGEGVEIEGPVSGLTEDGVLTLGLGDGSISLDTVGDPPITWPRGVRVTLTAVEVYPTGT